MANEKSSEATRGEAPHATAGKATVSETTDIAPANSNATVNPAGTFDSSAFDSSAFDTTLFDNVRAADGLTAAVRSTIGATEPIGPLPSASESEPDPAIEREIFDYAKWNPKVGDRVRLAKSSNLGQSFDIKADEVGTVTDLVNDGTPVRRIDVQFSRDLVPGAELVHFDPVTSDGDGAGIDRGTVGTGSVGNSGAEAGLRIGGNSASSRTEASRGTIFASVQANRIAIDLSLASLVILIDEKLTSLRNELPNDPDAQAARDEAIKHYEKLKQDVEALSEATSPSVGREKVETAAITFVEGVQDWWASKHKSICDKAFNTGLKALDVGIFLTCASVCSHLGAGADLAVAVSGVLVGGRKMVDVIKAAIPQKRK